MIDASERRDVAIVDIPNAFPQTVVDEEIFVRLRGKLAEMLIAQDENFYKRYSFHNKKASW